MPPGLGINLNSGLISGTPTTAGTYATVRITIHDSVGGTVTTTYTIVIAAAPSISNASLPPGELTIPYNASLAASGGSGTYTSWSRTGGTLPPGLSFNTATGAITGTPTATGTFSATYTVTDSAGVTSAPKTLSITINAVPTITTGSLPAGVVGQSYNAPMRPPGARRRSRGSQRGYLLAFRSTGAPARSPVPQRRLARTPAVAVQLTDSFGVVANARFRSPSRSNRRASTSKAQTGALRASSGRATPSSTRSRRRSRAPASSAALSPVAQPCPSPQCSTATSGPTTRSPSREPTWQRRPREREL